MHHGPSRRWSLSLEILESRQLLSGLPMVVAAPPVAWPGGTQLVSGLHPTYQELTDPGSLLPLATAGAQGFSPSQIHHAYGIDQVSFANGTIPGNGNGQTIAIIDAYHDPTIASDLHAFDQAFGLPDPPSFQVVAQDGSHNLPPVDPAGPGHSNWEGEIALDVQWAHAIAPGANILLVEANNPSPSNLFAAVDFARRAPGVSVVSMSFGGNEVSGIEARYDGLFTTPPGHNGVTFVASTGDNGQPGGYPAYSPNVVAVGGTSLALDALGNYQSETGWSGSGGGASQFEPQPAYQNGVVSQTNAARTIPDLSFVADPRTGVSVYDSYNNGTARPWSVFGGSSLAAPCTAGMFAIANQGRALSGQNTLDSGSAALPLIYGAPASDFHDVTSGNNGFAAGPGYDLVTGRGSPQASLLIPYLVNGTSPPRRQPISPPSPHSAPTPPASARAKP